MDKTTWLVEFSEALRELRPHVSLKLAETIALAEYRDGEDPKRAASAYHRRRQPRPEPSALPAKKRRR